MFSFSPYACFLLLFCMLCYQCFLYVFSIIVLFPDSPLPTFPHPSIRLLYDTRSPPWPDSFLHLRHWLSLPLNVSYPNIHFIPCFLASFSIRCRPWLYCSCIMYAAKQCVNDVFAWPILYVSAPHLPFLSFLHNTHCPPPCFHISVSIVSKINVGSMFSVFLSLTYLHNRVVCHLFLIL